eukprot:1977188-Heterocapsa_arctica.AAC.1
MPDFWPAYVPQFGTKLVLSRVKDALKLSQFAIWAQVLPPCKPDLAQHRFHNWAEAGLEPL